VKIHSKQDEGTRVDLYLPRHRGEVAQPEQDAAKAPAIELQRGKVILLVEDEHTMRLILSETLEEQGYQVLQAGGGVAALELLRSGASVDLLVTDVGLPGAMDGWQLADQATAIQPCLKAMFITGYVQAAGRQVLTKPFTLHAFASRVTELLADPATSQATRADVAVMVKP